MLTVYTKQLFVMHTKFEYNWEAKLWRLVQHVVRVAQAYARNAIHVAAVFVEMAIAPEHSAENYGRVVAEDLQGHAVKLVAKVHSRKYSKLPVRNLCLLWTCSEKWLGSIG
jgi:hypothetical protein